MSTDRLSQEDAQTVLQFLERMTELQTQVNKDVIQLNQVKHNAKNFGVDMEAANVLISLRTRFPADKGAEVLDDLFDYALLLGTELRLAPPAPGVAPAPADPPPAREEPAPRAAGGSAAPRPPAAEGDRAETIPVIVPGRDPAGAGVRLGTLAAQVGASLAVASTLIWLLH